MAHGVSIRNLREPAAQTQQRAANVAKVCSPGVGNPSSYKLANGEPALRYTMTYQGHSFTMKDCRDWTNIQVENPPIGFTAHNLTPDKTSCDNAGQHCRTYAFDPNANTGSIGLSTDFVSETLPITIDPRARKLRFEIAPESANDFDIVSAWLMVNP